MSEYDIKVKAQGDTVGIIMTHRETGIAIKEAHSGFTENSAFIRCCVEAKKKVDKAVKRLEAANV